MRKFALLVCFAGMASEGFAAKRVTVAQFEQVLAESHSKPDAAAAQELSGLELTERVSMVRLSRWEAEAAGPAVQRELVTLADASAFLDLPAAEIPATATPDFAAQRQTMALVATYVGKTVHQLPNFFATRATTRFEDRPQEDVQGENSFTSYSYQPLHFVGKASATVLYRDGKEVVDAKAVKNKKPETEQEGLRSWGEFGPILGVVLVDAAQGTLAWSHWEQGEGEQVAVFRYTAVKEKSHYKVTYCCMPVGGSAEMLETFQQVVGYHGEIAIDPTSGAILRLTVQAELKPTDVISRADILVEYGPVEIGGKTYICPVRSVTISLSRDLRSAADLHSSRNVLGPAKTSVNDVAFENYHLYRATARILADASSSGAGQDDSGAGAGAGAPASSAAPVAQPVAKPEGASGEGSGSASPH